MCCLGCLSNLQGRVVSAGDALDAILVPWYLGIRFLNAPQTNVEVNGRVVNAGEVLDAIMGALIP